MKGRTLSCLSAVVFLVLGACSEDDLTSPESLDSGSLMPSISALQLGQQETPDPNAVARAVPGFGGYFLDEAQRPTVYLKDVKQRQAAELALVHLRVAVGVVADEHLLLGEVAVIGQGGVGLSDVELLLLGGIEVDDLVALEARVQLRVLGERGRHTRSAIGFAALPTDICVEIEATFEVE